MAVFLEPDLPLAGAIVSNLKAAAAAGWVADVDFAVDETTTIAAINARNAKIHVTQQGQYQMFLEKVRQGFRLIGNTIMITDLATIYAAVPGSWPAAFSD